MPTFSRNATVDWKGTLLEGAGDLKAGTGAFTLPVSFPRRIGDPGAERAPRSSSRRRTRLAMRWWSRARSGKLARRAAPHA
jgi:hypothetical protein